MGPRGNRGLPAQADVRLDALALGEGHDLAHVLAARGAAASAGPRARVRAPWAMPWVSDSEKKPPLRPDAPNAMVSASDETMSADGSWACASIAAHSPVSPPPTTSTSQACPRTSGAARHGGIGAGRSRTVAERQSRRASAVRMLGWVMRRSSVLRAQDDGTLRRPRQVSTPRAAADVGRCPGR